MPRLSLLLWIPLCACDAGKITLDDTADPVQDSDPADDSNPADDSDPAVDADGDGAAVDIDCDDADPTVYPGAAEHCDGRDEDCDGLTDEDPVDGSTWFSDNDRDGFGGGEGTSSCEQPPDTSSSGGDCDDTDAQVHPDAQEVCDALRTDEDCDGLADDDDSSLLSSSRGVWYADDDGDGYGDPDRSSRACEAPSGYVSDSGDCDDTDATLAEDCTVSWDGTYSGSFDLDVTIASLGKDTCSGTGRATVTEAVSPALTGTLSCSFSGILAGLGSLAGLIDGDFTGTDTLGGEVNVSSYFTDTWTGTFSGDATLDGSFSGTTTLYGYSVAYTGSFSLTRL